MGTFAHLDPEMETRILARLGEPAPISNQVIQRDRHAWYISALALIASSLEKIAVEIRHLQRSEVAEVEEFFTRGKRDLQRCRTRGTPFTENVSGLAGADPRPRTCGDGRHPALARTGHIPLVGGTNHCS